MAQGLQCWDGSGRLIVDLGDYNLRYIGSQTHTLAGGPQWNIGFGGMTAAGWLVYPQVGHVFQNYAVKCYDGGYRIAYMPTSTPPTQSVTFDIWCYV